MTMVDTPKLLTVEQTAANILSVLTAAGVDASEARVESQLILEHCLGLDLAQRLMQNERAVTAQEQAQIDAVCRQRASRIPIQYCLGYAHFWGMKLAVTSGVLIPRTDTESLVQITLQKIRQCRHPVELIADIGTGSGAIAIALAKELPEVRIAAVDISFAAITLARENARTFNVEQQIDFLQGDWSSVLPKNLDTIVSNPPYLNDSHKADMAVEIAQYEPELALFGPGIDGLGFYRELADSATRYLRPDGMILLEVGDGQAETVADIFKTAGWERTESHKDLNGLPRVISVTRE
jgi:release factor glutamine methyltransferase